MYVASAALYLLGAVRDCGVLEWIPVSGCRSHGVAVDEAVQVNAAALPVCSR